MPLAKVSGLECIQNAAAAWGVHLRLLVIGGQAVLAYCGRVRVTKDLDLLIPEEQRGRLVGLLKECGFTVEGATFGIRAVRDSDGALEVVHISVGSILDESRGPADTVVYAVFPETYSNASRLALPGLVKAEGDGELVEAVLPLPDLLLTKLLPTGRETDLEDVLTLILRHPDHLDEADVAARVARRRELKDPILMRLARLAQFALEHEVGKVWLGQSWTPALRSTVLAFIRTLSARIRRI